jgi:tetratricopeptide (TPR) repeat protein
MSRSPRRRKKPLPRTLLKGLELQRSGRVEEAERAYRQALQEHPENADALHLLGTLYANQGHLEEARDCLARAVVTRASLASAWFELGNVQRDLGEFEAAIEAFAKALKHHPDLAMAHCARAQIRDYRDPAAYADEHKAMRQAHARATPGSRERRDLAWGLAVVAEQRAEVADALAFLAEAHAVDAAAQPYDRVASERYFERLREAIDADDIAERAQAASASERPVFVLGPPRSGSTLVEQILASHSGVFGAGELRWIGQLCAQMERGSGLPFAEAFKQISDRDMHSAANAYLKNLTQLAPSARHVVDKMPANLLAGAMLAALFPRARFIYCERDRAANAWSIYRTRFAEPHAFANAPADLVAYLKACALHRDYLAELLGERFLVVHYESLVTHPQLEIQRLLAHVGLEPEPACFQPEQTRRPVRTASALQVRQPIHGTANSRAEPFIDAFVELAEALEANP